MTKKCTKCKLFKDIEQFYKNSRYADGRITWCKACKKKYANENPHHVANWIAAHPQDVKAIKDNYVAKHPEEVKISKRKWSKANPKKELAKTRKYQASKLNATPKWLSEEQLKEMINIYVTCPEGYEIDHIAPLQGRNVRGLHVPWNLQQLPIKSNRHKSNKY